MYLFPTCRIHCKIYHASDCTHTHVSFLQFLKHPICHRTFGLKHHAWQNLSIKRPPWPYVNVFYLAESTLQPNIPAQLDCRQLVRIEDITLQSTPWSHMHMYQQRLVFWLVFSRRKRIYSVYLISEQRQLKFLSFTGLSAIAIKHREQVFT